MEKIKAGDKFTFKHPNYPNSGIVGKIMIAQDVTSSYVEPVTQDLVWRQFPIEYCTKVNREVKPNEIYKFE